MAKYQVDVRRLVRPVTRGAPALAGQVALRDGIFRNWNVRESLTGLDDDGLRVPRGSIAGVIGGPPAQRGIGGVAPPALPVIPPVIPLPGLPPPVVILPPVIVPPPAATPLGRAWPLAIQPVSFTFRVTGGAIDAFVSPQLQGPLFVHHVSIFFPNAEIDPNTTDTLVRIDVAGDGTLDAFGYGAGSYPTGVSSARETLFRYSTDSGEHLLPGQRGGWLWHQPDSTSDHSPDLYVVNRYINVNPAFIKVYIQQEDVTDRTIMIIVFVSEGADGGSQVTDLSQIVPRVAVQQLTRAEFRALQNLGRPAKNP